MRASIIVFTVAAGSLSGAIQAQESSSESSSAAGAVTIDEIMVTATRAGQTRLQDTPVAITAVDRRLIESSALRDIRDVQTFTPSLVIAQNARAAQPYIRGIGSNNSFSGSDPSVALYVDGVYIARPYGFFTELTGIERVEVLRGPQGTLYGRNSIGGAINIISRKPGEDFQAEGKLSVGNYNLRRGEVYLNVPTESGKVAVNFSGRYSDRDGYYENAVPNVGRPDIERDRLTRAQVRVTPNDRLELFVRADYSSSKSTIGTALKTRSPTGDPLTDSLLGDPDTVALSTATNADVIDYGFSAEIDVKLSESLRLTSITAYRKSDGARQTDNDFSAAILRYAVTGQLQDQISQELLLSGDAGRLSYVTGLYYITEDIGDYSRINNLGPQTVTLISPGVDSRATAAFAQGSFALTPMFSVTAGLRYTKEHKEFDQTFGTLNRQTGAFVGVPVQYLIDRDDDAFTPKLGVEIRPRDALMIYVSATRGFKSGGFSYTSTNVLQGFDPEEMWAYEAGVKSDWMDRKLRVNAAAFYYDYKDLQVQSFISLGVLDIANAASAKVKGFEFETQINPVGGLVLGASATWLDATYDSFPVAIGPGNVAYDASGRDMNAAPRLAYAFNAEYRHPVVVGGEVFGRVDYAWKDRQYFTSQNILIESQESYALVHANLGYRANEGRFEASLFGRNLADKRYFGTTATVGGISYGTLAPPRTYGLQLTARY